VQVFPTGGSTASSSLNVESAGQIIPNLVMVPLSAGGQVTIYVEGGGHVLADVFGYYTAAATSTDGRYVPVTRGRLLETRLTHNRLGAGGQVTVPVTGRFGIPSGQVAAAVLNVTADNAENPGYITVYPSNVPQPTTSNLNLVRAGQTMPNLVVVPVAPDGTVTVFSEAGADVIVDVFGYFTNGSASSSDAGLFVPVAPDRLLDTRPGAKPAARSITTLDPRGLKGIPASGVSAIFGNVTATQADPGWVQVLPNGSPADQIGRYSNVNMDRPDKTVANAAIANLGTNGIDLYADSSSHILVDTAGYFTTASIPPTAAISTTSLGNGKYALTANTTGEGILGVQFKVDGTNLGAEDTVSPFNIPTWTSATVPNGTHNLTATVRTAGVSVTSSPAALDIRNALVTLTFDDGWRSQLVNAVPKLTTAGMKATFFPISQALTDPPYMTPVELQGLKSAGHEIGSHTRTHCSLTDNPENTPACGANVLSELRDSQTDLLAAGLGPINNFASPFGDMNPTVLDIVDDYYQSHRGVDEDYNIEGQLDRFDLKVKNVYGTDVPDPDGHPITTGDAVGDWIDGLKVAQSSADATGWGILVFHEVADTPVGGAEYNVLPSELQLMINRIADEGVRVVTLQQGLEETHSLPG
jgi:peptidoglycan/xylan/chitin deacetylase (PgdA/CDA1 family)